MTPTTLRKAVPQSAHSASDCWSSCSSLSVPNPALKVVGGVDAASYRGEVLETPRRHHARVLDAHSSESHEVKARLHGDHVTLFQRLAVRAPHAGLLVHLQADAVAGAVVHLGDAVGSLVARGGGAVASVDQHLAHRVMDIVGRHARLYRFDRDVQRLQSRGVHPSHLFRYLADDYSPRQVAVVVAGAAGWKDVDDHRRARAYLALAAVVRHGVVGRSGDDHVGTRKAELRQ